MSEYTVEKPQEIREIPSDMLRVGPGAYCGDSMTTLIIPETVQSIGELAFGACRDLKKVEIQGDRQSISVRAFEGCENIESISLPKHITVPEYPGVEDYGRERLIAELYNNNPDIKINGLEMDEWVEEFKAELAARYHPENTVIEYADGEDPLDVNYQPPEEHVLIEDRKTEIRDRDWDVCHTQEER